MTWINNINSDPNQKITLSLPSGGTATLECFYRSGQQGWFYTLTYGEKIFRNRRIVTSPNMLRAFRNLVPFGLSCVTVDDLEPVFIDDFSSGRAKLYLLDSADILEVEGLITNAEV